MTMTHGFRRRVQLALVAAVTLLPFGPIAAQHTTTAEPYAKIGEAENFSCDFDRRKRKLDTCEAFPPFNLFDPSRAFEAGDWVAMRKWNANAERVLRSSNATLSIHMIKNPRKMPLNQLNRRGAAVARLQLDPEGPADTLYKIGGKYTNRKGFTGDFYIIVDQFKEVIGRDTISRKIANWRMFGLLSTGKLVPLKAHGAFRWCSGSAAMKHSNDAVIYGTCTLLSAVTALEKKLGEKVFRALLRQEIATPKTPLNDSKLSTADQATLRKAAEATRTEGASLPCGLGCCITEFAQDLPESDYGFLTHIAPLLRATALSPLQTSTTLSYSPRSAPKTAPRRGW